MRLEAAREAGAVAHHRGQRRRGRALAGDVADQACPAVLGREELVEVAAHVHAPIHAGGPVQRGELPTGDLGELVRAQAPLQDLGDVGERRVQTGVLDRHRGPVGELLGQLEVALVQAPVRLGGQQRHHPDDPGRRAHRNQQRGAKLEALVEECEVLVAERGVVRQLVAGVGEQPGVPDRRTRSSGVAGSG